MDKDTNTAAAIPDAPRELGLLRVVGNAELDAEEKKLDAAMADAEKENNTPLLRGLAAYVMSCWESARDAKNMGISERLVAAQQARRGEYSTQKLQQIKGVGGSEEYARVTANKCRVAEAWLRDVYLGQTEKPWTLNPTPSPSLPPAAMEDVRKQVSAELAQVVGTIGEPPPPEMIQSRRNELQDAISSRMRDEARSAVERMERKMEDQLLEGGFESEWGKFINDLVTYPAAHFKGPVLRRRSVVKWEQSGASWQPRTKSVISTEFERVDPARAYPSPNATTPQEGYFIEHVTFARDDLYELIGMEGFSDDAIRAVLSEYGSGGLVDWLGFTDLTEQMRRNEGMDRDKGPLIDIDGIEYHGPVRGADLIEWSGDDDIVPDAEADYEACVWMVGRWVIKATLNYDPTKTRPYFKASWEELPGSYWGLGLVDTLSDVQGVVNAAVRSLVNNMAMASGPQVTVNVDRLPPGESITTLTPWKIWQTNDGDYQGAGGGKPIEFFQPDANVNDLITVIEKFYQFADDWSLIPRYMSGNDKVGGAGRTASGLSMLLNAANKGLKGVVSQIDNGVLAPMLSKLYTFNMLFDEDETLKGDAQAQAKGAVSLMQLETLQLRRNEFLNATANEYDSQIVGLEGRAEILREIAKGLDLDPGRIVPPRGANQGQQPQPQAAAPTPGPAPNGETLMNGAATTDNFSPSSLRTPQ